MAGMNDSAKIAERILADAEKDAEAIKRAAEDEVAAILAKSEKACQQILAEAKQKAERSAESIRERSRTNAELEARKAALKARRTILDEAFKLAFDRLCALDGQARDALLIKRAVTEADGGEQVVASPADAERMGRLLPEINAKLAAANRRPISMSSKQGGFAGGFLLEGNGYEKNCSFEAMLNELRGNEEIKVAKILFD